VYFFTTDKKDYLEHLDGKDPFKVLNICGDNIEVDLKEIRCKNVNRTLDMVQ
jgi:hypothetical protein